MSSIPIPPLIPLPSNAETSNSIGDDKEDIFATLFSPATPRGSPTLQPVLYEPSRPTRHSRTFSVDSDFGSFVSVPSSEDPLHGLGDTVESVPFTPVKNFEFFDRFTEDAKAATERSKKDVLDELLQSERDSASFLRSVTPTAGQIDAAFPPSTPGSGSGLSTPEHPLSRAATPLQEQPPVSQGTGTIHPFESFVQPSHQPRHGPSQTLLPQQPRTDLLDELIEHENYPASFVETTNEENTQLPVTDNEPSLLDLDPLEDEHLERKSRHPSRRANWTEASASTTFSHSTELTRSPSLSRSPTRISPPEVQRTQSFFTPSIVSSSFPSRWVSSLLSRPAPALNPTRVLDNEVSGLPQHARAATIPGPSITHGTPFGSQPYAAPSGAPGFAGDRTWDKGFKFDKENVERASLKLNGRKEFTTGVLTVPMADNIRPFLPALKRLPRSWSLLYSLDQHGISLNTLYARCESNLGGALLIMRDSNDAIFGAWMGEGIKQSKGSYYGSGESFLFKVLHDESLKVYKWTGKNDYVALCEPEYISFGGGDGNYGLYLDETLSDGSSARCPTFENEPLCSAGPRQGGSIRFECVGLEIWGVG